MLPEILRTRRLRGQLLTHLPRLFLRRLLPLIRLRVAVEGEAESSPDLSLLDIRAAAGLCSALQRRRCRLSSVTPTSIAIFGTVALIMKTTCADFRPSFATSRRLEISKRPACMIFPRSRQ